MLLFQAVGVDPMWAYLIIGGIAVALAIAARRKYRKAWECGPGCICGGENLRTYQNAVAQQQSPAPLVIQAPQPMAYQQPAPQIIVLQAPGPQMLPQAQPQIIMLQAPAPQPQYQQPQAPQIHYLPAPEPRATYSPTYQPTPQAPMSYYLGHTPEPADYPQEVHYLQPAQVVGQLPPPRADEIRAAYEARRNFEREREEMRRR
jgi:hypothetical protein